jgi:hypothetical protein
VVFDNEVGVDTVWVNTVHFFVFFLKNLQIISDP